MAGSSIHIGNSSASALLHNARVFDVDYAIDSKEKNDIYEYCNIDDLVEKAKLDYQQNQKNNRRMSSRAQLIKEAIVNLNENHTLDDVKQLCQVLKEKFGYEPMHIAIHRDEGYIDENQKKHYNYHAHIMLLNYDFSKHKTVRPSKTTMSKMQTEVARELKMKRGIDKRISKRKRLNTFEYKQAKEDERQNLTEATKELKEIKTELAKIKDVKIQFKEEKQALIDSHTATQIDYTNLRKKYKELEEKARKKDLTIEKLKKELAEKPKTIEKIVEKEVKNPINKDMIEKVEELETELSTAVETRDKFRSYAQTFQKQLIEAQNELEEQKTSISTLQAENSVLRETIAEVTRYLKCKKDEIVEKVKSMFQKEEEPEDKAWEEVVRKNLGNQKNPSMF